MCRFKYDETYATSVVQLTCLDADHIVPDVSAFAGAATFLL